MNADSKLKFEAIALRKSGRMFSEIAQELGIAKSTAYSWTNNVQLSEVERLNIVDRLKLAQRNKASHLPELLRIKREKALALLQAEAASVIKQIDSSSSYDKIICSVMFWCEGGKDVRAGIQFINSDPILIKTFLHLLRRSFSINEAKFKAIVHIHDYHDEATQIRFWSDVTSIPISNFYRSYRKPHTGKNKRLDYQGCISIRYYDASLGKLLKMIYSEYGKL
jgi:hypothetical protein